MERSYLLEVGNGTKSVMNFDHLTSNVYIFNISTNLVSYLPT